MSKVANYISPLISTFSKEGAIVRDYFTGFSTAKSAMKGLQSIIINKRAYSGGKEWGTLEQGTKAVETLFDFRETFDRVVKVASHLPALLTGQESISSALFDGIDLGISAISTIRGFTRTEEGKWGLRTVSKVEYNYWTLAKMTTSGLWKGYLAFSKRNEAMDPFRRARDILIVIMLTQCAVNAFFNCFRETDKAKLAEWEVEKAKMHWEGGGISGIGRLLFYAEPIDPIKHDAHWMIRALAPIEKIFCNSLVRRYVGIGIATTAFVAHRNKCMAAAAA